MERYDYEFEVKNDVRSAISDKHQELIDSFNMGSIDRDSLKDTLYDELVNDDSVTGNSSGSYFCNAWKAEEALCHNIDLLVEALESNGDSVERLKYGAESCDVEIRIYVLGSVLDEILDEFEE